MKKIFAKNRKFWSKMWSEMESYVQLLDFFVTNYGKKTTKFLLRIFVKKIRNLTKDCVQMGPKIKQTKFELNWKIVFVLLLIGDV